MLAIYARQSVDKKDSISIDTQIEFCLKEIPKGSKYKVYQDKGFSGKNIERPAFQDLLKDIEDNRITTLVVYRLDRISRSITNFANIIDILEEKQVNFISANEKFDTSTPVGRAMLYIIMVFAQLERETIAERIRDNYYARGETGVWLGGPAPFGYNISKTKIGGKNVATIVPNKDLDVVNQIYDLYSNTSMSLGAISRKIRESRPEEMWNNIKLARILHNPAYVKADADIYTYFQNKKAIIINPIEEFTGQKGCSLYGKRDKGKNKYRSMEEQTLSLALHDGIVDSQTWLRCQEKAKNNTQIKNTGKGKHTWLTGLTKCGYCSHSMVVKLSRDVKYINCSGKYIKRCNENHITHYVDEIENIIYEQIKEYIISFKEKRLTDNKQSDENKNKVNNLKIELHNIEQQIENLISQMAQGNQILIEYANKKITELDNKKFEITSAINTNLIKPIKTVLPDITDWLNFNIAEKHEVAASLIDRILIYNDDIKIEWKG